MAIDFKGYQFVELLHESQRTLVARMIRDSDKVPVIVKTFPDLYPLPEKISLLRSEYEFARSAVSGGVVKALAFETSGHSCFMVSEDFGGESISKLFDKLTLEHFKLAEFLRLAIEIAVCLGKLHQDHIIHKNLTCDSVIYNMKTGEVKLCDLRFATRLSRLDPEVKDPNALEGDLAYISPEQTGRMNRTLDYRTDYYSLGVIYYRLLTGTMPFIASDPLELVHSHIAKQPIMPHQRNAAVPEVVSQIVMKLLKKTAEDRYQSVWGLCSDLKTCLAAWEGTWKIEHFPLGTEDIAERFQIPERLYGRDPLVQRLLSIYQEVNHSETQPTRRQLVLISGQPGVGKTALVKELHKPILAMKGNFVSGKFDQYMRDVPYSGIAVAFSELIRQILTVNEKQLGYWRENLQNAVGPNGQLLINLLPELTMIIGPQPEPQELGPTESRNRFNLVFMRFLRVFCKPTHPIVIFLDDLQWADSASLELLRLMISDDETENLLIIGAYRDAETPSTHPLIMLLRDLEELRVEIHRIAVEPLQLEEVALLISDTLHKSIPQVMSLAKLVIHKTQGNPFFTNEFLKTLHQENLLVYLPPHLSSGSAEWQWDLSAINRMEITDNVVELMVNKLKKLPENTQEDLQLASCVGNKFDLNTLSVVVKKRRSQTFYSLTPAVDEFLLIPESDLSNNSGEVLDQEFAFPISFRFQHDRVQQAAYSLIEETNKAKIHLTIGRLLLENQTKFKERFFEVVDHLNFGRTLMNDRRELSQLAELNRLAGEKARGSADYVASRRYFSFGVACLPPNSWQSEYELTLKLVLNLAESEYLNGNFSSSERQVFAALSEARSTTDKAELYNLLIAQYTLQGRYTETIEAGRKALAMLGVETPDEGYDQVLTELIAKARQLLGAQPISSLLEIPRLDDLEKRLVLKIIKSLGPPTYIANQGLFRVINLISANLSMEFGPDPESLLGYSNFGLILSTQLNEFQAGYDFGLLSLQLSEKYGDRGGICVTCSVLANTLHNWVKPIHETKALNQKGYQAALDSGDLIWAGYILMFEILADLYQGRNLIQIADEFEARLGFMIKTKNQYAEDLTRGCQLPIWNLCGKSSGYESFKVGDLSEELLLQRCQEHFSLAGICLYSIFKAQALYLYERPFEALNWVENAADLASFIPGYISLADMTFYHALILIELLEEKKLEKRAEYELKLAKLQHELALWEQHSPINFRARRLLVDAELASRRGEEECCDLYESAIEKASKNCFIQIEALANELYAKHWLRMGKNTICKAYMTEASRAYQQWGCMPKLEMLAKKYDLYDKHSQGKMFPLLEGASKSEYDSLLDLNAVLKVSHVISSEILLEHLLAKIAKTLMEVAGAQKICLILKKEEHLVIEAEGFAESSEVQTMKGITLEKSTSLCPEIVSFVARTKEDLLLSDATNIGLFTHSSYILKHKTKSILCVPLLKQAKLIGVLYFENNLTSGAFVPARVETLKSLASQAAISIENANLYHALQEYSKTLEQKVDERTKQIMKTQEELKIQERMASLVILTAGVAHEMRNPLNFINNFADSSRDILLELQEEVANLSKIAPEPSLQVIQGLGQEVDSNLKIIATQGGRAAKIIDSMMAIASHQGGSVTSISLNDLVKDYTNIVFNGRKEKKENLNAVVNLVLDPNIQEIKLIPQQIARALVSLLNNAFDAIQDKAKTASETYCPLVIVSTHELGNRVSIHVWDNGEGIPEKNLSHIFTPFFTTKPPGCGNIGLGLSMCYDIIAGEHKGDIRCLSKEGQYTEFIASIPKNCFS